MFESSGGGGLRLSCVGCLVDEEVSVIGFHYGCVLSFFFCSFLLFSNCLTQSGSRFLSPGVITS